MAQNKKPAGNGRHNSEIGNSEKRRPMIMRSETLANVLDLTIDIEELEAKNAPGGETVLPLPTGGKR
jgi:hypothetical protein